MARKETRGARFRKAVLTSYEITRADELELVQECAANLDLIDQLDAALAASGLTSIGSQGQPVINPLLPALQAARSELRRGLSQLKLPEMEAGGEQ